MDFSDFSESSACEVSDNMIDLNDGLLQRAINWEVRFRRLPKW